jgi:hypothetical protein
MDGKAGVQVEVQARVTNDEEQDQETAVPGRDLHPLWTSAFSRRTISQ